MFVKERFIWFFRIYEILREKFGRDVDYNLNMIIFFVGGKIKYFWQDFFEVVKKVFFYVNFNWFIVGEGLKWVSLLLFGVDFEWDVVGGVVV